MYPLIRDIHLASGLFTLVLLAVYALSAVLMSHPGVLAERERITQQELEVPPNGIYFRNRGRVLLVGAL